MVAQEQYRYVIDRGYAKKIGVRVVVEIRHGSRLSNFTAPMLDQLSTLEFSVSKVPMDRVDTPEDDLRETVAIEGTRGLADES